MAVALFPSFTVQGKEKDKLQVQADVREPASKLTLKTVSKARSFSSPELREAIHAITSKIEEEGYASAK